jgi:hypothetical protein
MDKTHSLRSPRDHATNLGLDVRFDRGRFFFHSMPIQLPVIANRFAL